MHQDGGQIRGKGMLAVLNRAAKTNAFQMHNITDQQAILRRKVLHLLGFVKKLQAFLHGVLSFRLNLVPFLLIGNRTSGF